MLLGIQAFITLFAISKEQELQNIIILIYAHGLSNTPNKNPHSYDGKYVSLIKFPFVFAAILLSSYSLLFGRIIAVLDVCWHSRGWIGVTGYRHVDEGVRLPQLGGVDSSDPAFYRLKIQKFSPVSGSLFIITRHDRNCLWTLKYSHYWLSDWMPLMNCTCCRLNLY